MNAPVSNRLCADWDFSALPPQGLRTLPRGAVCGPWLAASMLLAAGPASAQEGLRNSLAGDAAAEARQRQPESRPYTIKSGDFRLLVVPSLGVDWNDNIFTTKDNPQDDFILRPLVQLNASYPLTQRNLLNLNVGFGYDKYFNHDELSNWRLQSGSELSLDLFVKDFWINLHDRFQYSQDSAQQSAVAGTGEYGVINNTAGLLVTWNLQDVTASLGYDHANVISPRQQFQSQDRTSELVTGRVGLRVHPRVAAGLEATASFTAYDQRVLNDNTSYSVGAYADWQPGSYLHVLPRAGYTFYQFQHTSLTNQTADLNSWYADLTVRHEISAAVTYSFSAGHEVRLGIQSDANEVWYFRPSIDWKIIKDLGLQTFLSYDHGKQGVGNVAGNLTETYDWFGGGLNLSRPITDRFTLGLNYRFTLRSSDAASREYAQNLVGLQLTYRLP